MSIDRHAPHTYTFWILLCSVYALAACAESSPAQDPRESRQFALGAESTCVRTESEISCWGKGNDGQLGDGFGSDRLFARPINLRSTPSTIFSALAVGFSYGCSAFSTGALYCWGSGLGGVLGIGSLADSFTPSAVALLDGESHQVVQISAGRYHACAITTENMLYCWGYSGNGQLGTGDVDMPNSDPAITRPKAVRGSLPIVSFSAGGFHTCAVYENGHAACWGNGGDGQLGNACVFRGEGDPNSCQYNHAVPIMVPYFDASSATRFAVAVDTGNNHSCIRSRNDAVFCFGRGDDGQLGNNAPVSFSVPQHVGNIPDPVRVLALGNLHSCVLTTQEEIYCFGDNAYGQLGNGSHSDSALPVQVDFSSYGTPQIVDIDAGAFHTCAWERNGAYYCWGKNSNGQLGTGTVARSHPIPIRGVY